MFVCKQSSYYTCTAREHTWKYFLSTKMFSVVYILQPKIVWCLSPRKISPCSLSIVYNYYPFSLFGNFILQSTVYWNFLMKWSIDIYVKKSLIPITSENWSPAHIYLVERSTPSKIISSRIFNNSLSIVFTCCYYLKIVHYLWGTIFPKEQLIFERQWLIECYTYSLVHWIWAHSRA